jgi:hypothetical protein
MNKIDPKNIKVCKRCNEEKECPYGKYYCRACQALFCKEYKAKNKEKIAEYNKKYKSEHKEEVSEYNQRYNKDNREVIQNRQREQHKERRKKDYNYRKSNILRKNLLNIIKDKRKDTKMISCSKNFFIKWLQFNLNDDMNFENYGEIWCIDHVIPCSLFNFEKNEDDEIKCFHWTNLRPLYIKENQKRQNKLTREDIINQEKKVEEFIQNNKEETINIIHYDKFKYLREQ